MKKDNLFLGIAILAATISLVATLFTLFSFLNFLSVTGYQVSTGTANLTVETQAIVNFTTRAVNFGSGRVNPGQSSANLFTVGSGAVGGGNWTAASGLILENTGNVNVTLNLSVGKNASNFIGGTNPGYLWNLSNSESGSCINSTGCATCTGNLKLDNFYVANTSQLATLYCDVFRFTSANDQVRIDFNLTIPENSMTGALSDVITATVTAL